MPYKDDDLPPKTYTLREFNRAAGRSLLRDQREFAAFTLTGRADDHQVVLDPLQNSILQREPVEVRRDFDSLIGISTRIILTCDIIIYPVSSNREVLTESVHFTIATMVEDVSPHSVSAHRIPNISFGRWGERNQIRILFPKLWSNERNGVILTQNEQREFYNLGLRPAMEELNPHEMSDWPALYDDEMFRAQKRSGAYAFQGKMVSHYDIDDLTPTIRRHLQANNVNWAEGFIFMFTVRGTKAISRHSMTEDSATTALADYLFALDIPIEATQDEQEQWYIDVGLEFYNAQHKCLQWRTDSHFHIIQDILNINDRTAQRITDIGSSKYSRDLSTHLTAVSGCRVEPGSRGKGQYEAVYVQMYTTDKAATYNPEGRFHGSATTCKEVMGITQPPEFCQKLFKLYQNASERIYSSARVEVRVPIKHATTILQNFSTPLIRTSLLIFDREIWWGFKSYRLLAATKILGFQALGSPELRIRSSALKLTIACTWLINGLHSRPDDGQAARSLMDNILPLVEQDLADRNTLAYIPRGRDDDDGLHPHNPYGVVFFKPLYMGANVPRFRIGYELPTLVYQFFFGMDHKAISNKYFPVGIVRPREGARPGRVVTNKTHRTPLFVNWTGVPPSKLFDLASKKICLLPHANDDGSDLDEPDDSNDPQEDIDSKLTGLWTQFLIDVMAKTPNQRGGISYCKLSAEARKLATEACFRNKTLSDVWNTCAYKMSSYEDRTCAFKHLWPPKDHILVGSTQNYANCRYYEDWKILIARIEDKEEVELLRKALRARLETLYWIPHACQDKLWVTSRHKDFQRLPLGTSGPAPRLLINGRLPKFVVPVSDIGGSDTENEL
ncbi:hypothetical protein BDQ12DRAFT_772989 [Crucibulum laeve]|uniref:Uncharacterized protein n=1 Tax=Crucibulum laeve TaxID=68775 RepID=A0A5C3LUX5_9AGAR|nr:hypothetical protein BDQ12DRAFT_772989 [Crucibulum laeve]